MGKVGLLSSISHTWVKAHTQRQDPAYVGPFPLTQNLKNIFVYARTELCMHKYKLCMQAQAHARKNTDRSSSSIFSKMHHLKLVLDMFLPLLRHQVFI